MERGRERLRTQKVQPLLSSDAMPMTAKKRFHKIGRGRRRTRSSSTVISMPTLTSCSKAGRTFCNTAFTYSIREDESLRVISDGRVSPVNAISAEKSRSWVSMVRCSWIARATMRSSGLVVGSIELIRRASGNKKFNGARGNMEVGEKFHPREEVFSLANHAPYFAA